MRRRSLSLTLTVLTVVLLCGTSVAQTRYDYGGARYGGAEEGFVVFVEAGVANPRNTDNIVAAVGPNVIIPEWDDEFAGRIGFGYEFGSGNKIVVSFWRFDAEQDAAGSGTPFALPIGPTTGSSFDVTTEIKAQTAEASWIVAHELTDSLGVEWSAGLRFAGFEETTDGVYDTTIDVAKSNEADMIGARFSGRATYRRGPFSGGAGVGLAVLDGEVEARSSLSPQPAGTSPVFLSDDSRSGTILDLEVRGAWHSSSDNVSVWIGWEQQIWEDIAADLSRNLPGTDVISRERDSVTFSWAKAGVSFKF